MRDKLLILVVDDDLDIRNTIQYVLSRDGYDVIEAENGMQAISAFKSHNPDIILLDILMPAMDGISVCNEIRKLPEGKHVPILMVTSLNDNDSMSRAFNSGANEFIRKPIPYTMLRHRVQLLLNAKQTEDALKKSEEHFRRLSENACDIIYRLNLLPEQQFEYLSPSTEKITGYPPEVFYQDVGMFLQCVHPEDKNDTIVGSKVTGDIATNAVFRLVRPNGKIKWVETKRVPIYGNDGNLVSVEGIMRDITVRKQLEEELVKAKNVALKEKEFSEKILQTATMAIFIVSLERKITLVNDEFCKITGYKREEVLGRECDIIGVNRCHEKGCILFDPLRKEAILQSQCEMINKDGRKLTILKNANLLRDNEGIVIGGIESFVDITELVIARKEAEKARKQAEQLASTDYLTGLLNRRAFTERLRAEYERAKRNETSLSVIIADIDHFKSVNDKYGHQVGDTVLQIFANTLSRCCRPYDFAGRYGGEEFIICLPRTNREQAVIVAERMRTNVQDMETIVPTVKEIIKITSSFGVSELEYGSKENTDILISRADDALYQAKREGRNKVCSLNSTLLEDLLQVSP